MVVVAGTEDGPYRSTDGGDHWHKLNFPDSSVMIWSLAIHPTRPNVMYAGAAPIALFGRGDGSIKPGRFVAYEKPTPMTNLYVALLDHMDVRTEKFGDSNGKLEHLSEL